MKKLTFMALAATAIMAASCGNKAPKPDLKDEADSLAYTFGLAQSEGLKQAIMQNGVDSTLMDEFYKGFMEGANAGDDKKKAAYMTGLQFGQIISQRMVPGLNQDIYAGDSTKSVSLKNIMAGLMAGVNGEKTDIPVEQAQAMFERLMGVVKAKQYEPNIKAGEEYVKKFAKQAGVKKLDSCNVYYKVIKEGNGEKPTVSSMVTVHYEGKNIEGKVFDSSIQRGEPAKMAVGQVIKGWQEVMKAMPVGSKWECVIPADLAYGDRAAGEFLPPYSTLHFTIELISIDK